MKAAVALGGNAILRRGERGTIEEQRRHVEGAARQLSWLVQRGDRILVTHGNGPQVGDILLKQECARDTLPMMPLDVCVAESQGMIGYLIQQALENELRRIRISRPIVTCVTQTLVDCSDPAFLHPSKPIGPHYTRAEAEANRRRGWEMKETGDGLFRRVVPSPVPLEIVEAPSIRALFEAGFILIAAGGGGIPVRKTSSGLLTGVEAVVDKDLATERIAIAVGAEYLLLLTDVPAAFLRFGTPDAEAIGHVSADEAERWLREGHFGEGSMRPKVEAGIRFVREGGRAALITSLEQLRAALERREGTWITP